MAIYTNDGIYLAAVMRDHLNSWEDRPADFMLEDLGTKVPSLMLQQLASAEKKKAYVNGSYIGTWSFAVYIRVNGRDTNTRLDATATLIDLAKWLTFQSDSGAYVNLPFIDRQRRATKIEMITTPSIAARYDGGIEDYQAVFQLEYQVRRI